MKNYSVLIAGLFLLIIEGCEHSISNKSRQTKEFFAKNNTDSLEAHTHSDQINIDSLIYIINEIYGLTDYNLQVVNLDTVYNYFMENMEIYIEKEDGTLDTNTGDPLKYYKHSLYVFSPNKANYLYEYGPFSFLEFKNDTISKDAFCEIFIFFRNSELSKQYTKDYSSLFHSVFSKSGAAYFLKDKFIIRYWRSCSEDYKKENNLESRLLSFLYPESLSVDSGYYMKYCCSCPTKSSFEVR